MKNIALVLVCLAAAAGCGARTDDSYSKPHDADNTSRNAADKDGWAQTPIDQKSNDADMQRTQDIRKRIVDAKLSVNATNVKVVTANGRVTLRGPVKSQAEKDTIDRIARDVAGDGNVDDQIEVESER
jgi:hyperosmotically inducible periplasmic protein